MHFSLHNQDIKSEVVRKREPYQEEKEITIRKVFKMYSFMKLSFFCYLSVSIAPCHILRYFNNKKNYLDKKRKKKKKNEV